MPNVPLLGAFAAVTGVIGLDSLVRAIREKFPAAIAERNVAGGERGVRDRDRSAKEATNA